MTKMSKLDKTHRDIFLMDFVQFVSSPQTSAKRLRKWNSTVKLCPANMIEEEWMRLWRGVYYIVWYEEMRKGGEEFIKLIAEWRNPNFILTGFKSMSEFWGGIDAFRIDKYMFLARHMLRNLFTLLQDDEVAANFQKQQIVLEHKNNEKRNVIEEQCQSKLNQLIQTYSMYVIDYILTVSASSIGFSMHLYDIFLEELQNCVPDVQKQCYFIIPFVKRLTLVDDDRMRNALNKKIFHPFISSTLGQSNSKQTTVFFNNIAKICSNLASTTENGKNRRALYDLSEFCKTSIEKITKARHENGKALVRKPTGYNRQRHRFRYEKATSIMYPMSIKPLAFICES